MKCIMNNFLLIGLSIIAYGWQCCARITADQIKSTNINVLTNVFNEGAGQKIVDDILIFTQVPRSPGQDQDNFYAEISLSALKDIIENQKTLLVIPQFLNDHVEYSPECSLGGPSLEESLEQPVEKSSLLVKSPSNKYLPARPPQPSNTLSQLGTWLRDNVNFSVSVRSDDSFPCSYRPSRGKGLYCDVGIVPQQSYSYGSSLSIEDRAKFVGFLSKEDKRAISGYRAGDFKAYYAPLYTHYNQNAVEIFLLQQYFLYRYPAYRQYLATLDLYQPFIIELTQQMRKNKNLGYRLDGLDGFACTRGFLNTGIGKTKSEFRDWIYGEASKILKEKATAEEQRKKLAEQQAAQRHINNKVQQLAQVAEQTQAAQQAWHAAEQDRRQHEQIVPDVNKIDELADLFYHLSQQESLNVLNKHDQQLVTLGIACIDHAYAGNVDEQNRWYQRAHALAATLDNASITKQAYTLGKTDLLTAEQRENYTSCTGNLLQHCVHSELVTTINQASDLWSAYTSDPYINNMLHLTAATTDAGVAYNHEQTYHAAMAQSDYASGLLAVAQHWADFVKDSGWMLYRAAAITAEGIVQGTQQGLTTIKHMIEHPVDTVTNLLTAIGKLGEFCLCAGMLADNADNLLTPPPDEVKIQAFCKDYGLTKENFNQALQAIKKDPAAVYKNSVAFVTEGVIVGKTTSLAMKGTGVACCAVTEKTIQAIRKAVTNESKLATLAEAALGPELAATEQAQTLLRPLQTGLQEGILTGAAEMVEAETVAVKTTTKIRELFEKPVAGSLAEDVATLQPKQMLNVDMQHLLMPQSKRKDVLGFHSRFDPQIREQFFVRKTCFNEYGCYGGYYKATNAQGGIVEKFSHFFPDEWSPTMILQKGTEAFLNPVQYQRNGFIGITDEGLKIQFWFKKNKINHEIIISSFYPYFSDI